MINNKVIIITGGLGKIGLAISSTLLKEGGNVVISDIKNKPIYLKLKKKYNKKVLFIN